MQHTEILFYDSPLGFIKITGVHDAIFSAQFTTENNVDHVSPNSMVVDAARQLKEYFSKKRKSFELNLLPAGTAFQRKVWDELLKISFGKTKSYLDIAKSLGDEKSIRAAASANGKNPLAIIIPCHRVIGSDGSLTGYAGGLWRKEFLLQHEESLKQMALFPSSEQN